jgi:uncharacterized membrane protein HdeD (DUF308 family)
MRNLISGVVGIVLGAFILLGSLLRGGPQGEGAYRAGQVTALLFGLLCLVAGIYYLVKGIKERSQPPARPKRPRRRVRDEDEE